MRGGFRIGRKFQEFSRWTLVAALIYAPWDYGGTDEEGVRNTTYLLSLSLIAWGIGLTIRAGQRAIRRSEAAPSAARRISPLLLAATISLLLFGWLMVINARAIYDSELHLFVTLQRLWSAGPGSVDQALSAAWMWRATTLLGAICLVADAVRDPRWLLRIWATVAAVGSSIALLGLVQKASGAPMIFWRPVDRPVATFFATFPYHGNAGAFMNLALPLTIGLAIRAFSRPGQPVVRRFG